MAGLHVEVRGNGPDLVLLHGWALNLRVWDGLAAALCDRFRLIAVDLPGHGRSEWLAGRASLAQQAVQVHETVAALTTKYSLVGWSFGGQIALQLAADYPAAVERLVLIAATPRLTAGEDWPHGAAPERLAAQAAGLRADYRRAVSDFLELQVRGSAAGAASLAQLRAALFAHDEAVSKAFAPAPAGLEACRAGDSEAQKTAGAPGPCPPALARDLELLQTTDLRPLLGHITVPALVIAGQYDRVTPPAASAALAQALPAGRHVELRRAAHAPFLSHLPQLATLVADFLLPT